MIFFEFFDTKFFIGTSIVFFLVSAVFVAYEWRIQSEFEKEKEKGNMKKSHIMAWTGFSFFILGLCIQAYKIMINRKPKVVNAGTDAVTDEDEGEGEGDGD